MDSPGSWYRLNPGMCPLSGEAELRPSAGHCSNLIAILKSPLIGKTGLLQVNLKNAALENIRPGSKLWVSHFKKSKQCRFPHNEPEDSSNGSQCNPLLAKAVPPVTGPRNVGGCECNH